MYNAIQEHIHTGTFKQPLTNIHLSSGTPVKKTGGLLTYFKRGSFTCLALIASVVFYFIERAAGKQRGRNATRQKKYTILHPLKGRG
jgi:hypothetical protein